MKKLLLLAALTGFGLAAQAGDSDSGSCCMGCCGDHSTTVPTSTATGATSGTSCCSKAKAEQAKAAHAKKAHLQNASARKPLQSPKAMSLACR